LIIRIERLTEINPKIIIAKMSAYGMVSRLSNHAGHDINFLSHTGILDTVNTRLGKEPVFPSVFIGDVSGAVMCVISILLALMNKAKGFETYQVAHFLNKAHRFELQ